jgi:hypothetical protein
MTYAYRETSEERQRITAALEKMGVSYPPKPRAEVVDLNTGQPRRQPLGLRPDDPANNEDDDPAKRFKGFHFRHDAHGARPEDALRSDWVFHYFDVIGAVMIALNNDTVREINDLWPDVVRKIKESESAQRLEVAELKTVIAELKGEVSPAISSGKPTHPEPRRDGASGTSRCCRRTRADRTRRTSRPSRRRGGDDRRLGADARAVRAYAGSRRRNARRKRSLASVLRAV